MTKKQIEQVKGSVGGYLKAVRHGKFSNLTPDEWLNWVVYDLTGNIQDLCGG